MLAGTEPAAWGKVAKAGYSNSLLSEMWVRLRSARWLALVGLLSALLCAPFMRPVSLGDEGMMLHAADRMLTNQRLYIDFFEFLPPGGFVVTAAWFAVAGVSYVSARLLAIATIVGIACFTYLSCRQASKNVLLSALLPIGWVAMSQGVWTQVSHQWFTTLFSMVTAWTTLAAMERSPGQPWWRLIAGTAAGMAAVITPTRGALAVLAGVAAFPNLRTSRAALTAYLLGCSLVPAILLLYVVRQHALTAAFDDVILWSAQQYSSIQHVPFGSFADAQNFPIACLFPLTALLAFLLLARDRWACLHDRLLHACVAFSLAGFLGCFPRPDIVHVGFVVPLACPLLACCATRLTQGWRPGRRHVMAAVAIGLCGPAILSFADTARSAMGAKVVPTPRGGVSIFGNPGLPELLARIAGTPATDGYFFYPYIPTLAFLTARQQVSGYDIFMPGYTRPLQYQDACLSAVWHATWVVIDQTWTDPNLLKRFFPAMRDTNPSEKARFERALTDGFALVAQQGAFQLLHRREGITDAICADIAR